MHQGFTRKGSVIALYGHDAPQDPPRRVEQEMVASVGVGDGNVLAKTLKDTGRWLAKARADARAKRRSLNYCLDRGNYRQADGAAVAFLRATEEVLAARLAKVFALKAMVLYVSPDKAEILEERIKPETQAVEDYSRNWHRERWERVGLYEDKWRRVDEGLGRLERWLQGQLPAGGLGVHPEVVRWFRFDAADRSPFFKFGKYRGQRLADAETKYLKWIVGDSTFPQPVKDFVQAHIDSRR